MECGIYDWSFILYKECCIHSILHYAPLLANTVCTSSKSILSAKSIAVDMAYNSMMKAAAFLSLTSFGTSLRALTTKGFFSW